MIEIDKHKVYESHGYRFINFIELSLDQKKMILEWRNHEKVRLMMVNKDPISLQSHLDYIRTLENRNDCFYWLVEGSDKSFVGVLDLLHVDLNSDMGELGFYLNPSEAGKGFEFMIECNYFVYGVLKLGNNHVTVNSRNKEILLFNEYVGTSYEGSEVIDGELFFYNKHLISM